MTVKTAISLPDRDFDRFEAVAARHGLSRSGFYRAAAERYADALEGGAELTRLVNAAIAEHGQPDDSFALDAMRQTMLGNEW